jgi:hypothetical protein
MSKKISSQDISTDIQMSFDEYKTLPFISGIASLMFYRCLSHFESQKELNAKSKTAIIKSAIPENLQWENWSNLRGKELKVFIKTQLIPNLINIRKTQFSHYYKHIVTVLEHQENQSLEFLDLNNDTTMDWLAQFTFKTQAGRANACQAIEEVLYGGYFSYGSTLDDSRIPRLLDDLMVKLLDPVSGKTIYDPCFGIGGLLAGCVEHLKKKGGLPLSKSILSGKNFNIYGMEINILSYIIALTRICLSGGDPTNLILGDTLLNQSTQKSFSGKFDYIIAVPPWGGHVSDQQRSQFSFKTWDSEGLFLQHIMASLRPNGRAVVAIPDRILYRGNEYKKLRQKMLNSFNIERIVSLPALSFAPYSPIKSSIISIRREKQSQTVLFNTIPSTILENWQMPDRLDSNQTISLINLDKTENIWRLPVNELKKRDFQLLPKQFADETLERFINNLFSIDPAISQQPLTSVADIYQGISLKNEIMSYSGSEDENRFELLTVLENAQKTKKDTDIYLIESKCWDALANKENEDELRLIKLRDFDVNRYGLDTIIEIIRGDQRSGYIIFDQQPLYLRSSEIEFIKTVRSVSILTYAISQNSEKLDDKSFSYGFGLDDWSYSYRIPVVKATDITTSGIQKPTLFISVEEIRENIILQQNDYLLTISGFVGKGAIVKNAKKKMTLSKELALIKPKNKIHPVFLAALLNSEYYQAWFRNNLEGVTNQHISLKTLGTLPILLPSIDLQNRVAKIWDKTGEDACLILIKELAASQEKKSVNPEVIKKLINAVTESNNILKKENKKFAEEEQKEYEFQMVQYLKHNLNSKIGQLKMILETIEGFLTKINLLDTPLQEPLFEGDEVGSAREFIKDGINNLKQMKGVLTSVTDLVTEEYRDEDFELIDLNDLFENDIIKPRAQNFDINIKCDAKSKLRIHKKSFVEALNQIIENAKKHGFVIPRKHYKIFFNITETVSEIIIDYINDGEPLPENITAKEFLTFGKSGVDIKGEGLGGSWIGKALKAINADFKIIRDNNPVHFRISIPKE